MKTTLITLLLILCAAPILRAEKSKHSERKIAAAAGQKIEIVGLSSANVAVKSWDKSEVYIKITVKFLRLFSKFTCHIRHTTHI